MSIRLIGEGGSVFTFDLPLHETMQDKLARRELRPADDESAEAVAELLGDSDEEPEPIAPAGVAAHVDMSASVKNILEAVDSDAEVAAAVLEAELSADEPRTTLIEALGEIIQED